MSGNLCRPCRDLARRQALALIKLNQVPRAAPVVEIARNSRRQFHQTTAHRENERQREPEMSSFAKVVSQAASAVLPGQSTQPYSIFGPSEVLFKACSAPAEYKISKELRKKEQVPTTKDGEEIGVGGGIWHDEFNLLPTFSTWSQVTMLHLYLLVVRLRCLERQAWQEWQTQLVDHFFQHAEDLMAVNHGMPRAARSRYLNSLFHTWRGVILAYDEGLVKGDAVMAAAVWRNVFRSSEDVDMRHIAGIVAWMRMTLRSLDELLEPTLLHHGASVFETKATAGLGVVDTLPPLRELMAAKTAYEKSKAADGTSMAAKVRAGGRGFK